MIDVAMREKHGAYWPLAEYFIGQRERGTAGLLNGKGVDNDPARVALDNGHVGKIQAADLIDAFLHPEETVDIVQPRLPPEAGVDGRGCLAFLPGVIVCRPYRRAVGVGDPWVFQPAKKPATGILEITPVVQWQK